MAKVGDRVIVEGTRLGHPRREGVLLAEVGRMIRVRWEDGTESMLTPAPGTVQYLPGNSKGGRKASSGGSRRPARKPAAKSARSTTSKAGKGASKRTTARPRRGGRTPKR